MSHFEKYLRIREIIECANALKDSAESGNVPMGWTQEQWEGIQLSDYLEIVAENAIWDIRDILGLN